MIKHKETIYVFDISNIIHYVLMNNRELDQEHLSRIIKFVTHFVLIEYYGYTCGYQDYEIDKVVFKNYGFKLRDRQLVNHMIDMWEAQFFKFATGVLSRYSVDNIVVELNGSNLIIRIAV